MNYWDYGPLKVTTNGHYLETGSRPFFWLGDTAWLLFQKLDFEDAGIYLRNRKEKGYNVIQTVLIHSLTEEQTAGNRKEFHKILPEEYWKYCEKIVDLAREMNLYIALLPAWGSLVKQGILTMDNVEEYGRFLGERFQEYPNIIWVLGGDIRGDVNPDVFRKLGATLKSYNTERLMTFHPFGRTSSSLWFHEDSWLDINMFQSGHRRYDQILLNQWDDNTKKETFFGEDNWEYVKRDQQREVVKPVLDGEPSYEGIPQGLHNKYEPYWEAADVRRYAYWSVFQGAAGHTYGNNAIMQFYTFRDGEGSYGVREEWKDALHHVGSNSMQYLRTLMESVDFTKGLPANELLISGQKERYHHISVFAGSDYIFVYDYSGDEFQLNLSSYCSVPLDAYWMNPADGVFSFITTLKNEAMINFRPIRRKGIDNDWVLVLKPLRN